MKRWAPKVGAIAYALWGLLHIWASGLMLVADSPTRIDYLSTAPTDVQCGFNRSTQHIH
ncbi:MAG: hypothetical protein ACE5OQ_06675 [Woeseia sp.]